MAERVLLYLVRHGETALNAEGRLRGWTDPPLNAKGRREAMEAGRALRDVDLSCLYISDLRRARQTGQSVEMGQRGEPKTQVTAMLRPIRWGKMDGQLMTAVGPRMGAYMKAWEKKPGLKVEGGGESFDDFQDRMEEVAEVAVSGHHVGAVGIVAHLRNCVWMLAYTLNGGERLEGKEIRLMDRVTQEVGKLSVLSHGEDGWKVLAMNTESPVVGRETMVPRAKGPS